MPKSRSNRTRRTKAQWTEILQRFESSGQDARGFCRREGVALSSFQRWRRQLGCVADTEFVELLPDTSSSDEASTWSLDVSLPNGVNLRFQG
jgi:hypothetical protein